MCSCLSLCVVLHRLAHCNSGPCRMLGMASSNTCTYSACGANSSSSSKTCGSTSCQLCWGWVARHQQQQQQQQQALVACWGWRAARRARTAPVAPTAAAAARLVVRPAASFAGAGWPGSSSRPLSHVGDGYHSQGCCAHHEQGCGKLWCVMRQGLCQAGPSPIMLALAL
jgi:hypothetical protein